jgi:uncharacterized membrane protein YhhN
MTRTSPRLGLSNLFFIVAAIVAMSHLANDWIGLAQPWGLAWKASGIVLLGLYALSQRAWLAGVALLLCATGDVLLEIVFEAGMAAFALGHIVYIFCFLEWGRVLGPNKRDYPVAGIVLVASLILLVWFFPGLGGLMIPALIYQAVITVMVATAMVVKAPMIARLGAVMFMVSDTLIAIGKFTDIDPPAGSVWITYAGAQIMIAWGLSRIAPYRDRARIPADQATV